MIFKKTFFVISAGIILLLVPVLVPSCTHEPAGIENMDTVCFNTQILPILQTSCAMSGCHDGSQEGFSASDYESVMRSVVAGKPRSSKLYTVLSTLYGENMMPPNHPLTKDQRMLIEIWILQGAPKKICTADTTGGGGGGGGGVILSDSVCFVQKILPVLVSSCGTTGCHDASSQREGYVFADYATIVHKGILPFNANGSRVYKAITNSGEDRMPPSGYTALTSKQIADLKTWINDGALNSDCPGATCDTTGNISYSTQLLPILQGNCIGCHNTSSANGNVDLSSYNKVKTVATTIRNGKPLLTGVVRRLPGFVAMPQSFSLDECSIRKMELWIAQGTLNN
jgi:hypothetical protein